MEENTPVIATPVVSEVAVVADTPVVPYWAEKSGIAPIKAEYVLWHKMKNARAMAAIDDDAAEGSSSRSTLTTTQVENGFSNSRNEEDRIKLELASKLPPPSAGPVDSASTISIPAEASTSTSNKHHHPSSDPDTPSSNTEPEAKKVRLSGAQKKVLARAKADLIWDQKMAAKRNRKAEAKALKEGGEVLPEVDDGGRNKLGGQNKGRTFNHRAGAFNLCSFAARGEVCTRSLENKCRQSHDLVAYIAARPADVPISLPVTNDDLSIENRVITERICPIYTSLGKCSQGFKCRFAKSHMRKAKFLEEGEVGLLGTEWILLVDEDKVKTLWEARGTGLKEIRDKGEINVIDADQMRSMRGYGLTKEQQYPQSAAYLASIGEPMEYAGAQNQRGEDDGNGKGGKRGGSRGRGGKNNTRGGKNGGGGGGKDTDSMSITSEIGSTDSPTVYIATDDISDEEPEASTSTIVASTSTLETPSIPTSTNVDVNIDSHPSRTFILDLAPIRATEKKRLDFKGKLYLAPLTTTGNLPFRRLCTDYGVDITCSEMGLAQEFLGGSGSEWSLVRRHPSEKMFGVQICGSRPQILVPTAEAIVKSCDIDFLDLNLGCPIDLVFNKGAGSALLQHASKLGKSLVGMSQVLGEIPLTIKIRTGIAQNQPVAHKLITKVQKEWGVSSVTLHGRSRNQRYKNKADYGYIAEVAKVLRETAADDGLAPIPIFGNGDAYDYRTYYENMEASGVDGIMIARGALVKPWIFTEIKERRDFDISSRERLDMVGTLARYGLEHWGSDTMGINTTRRFLCEALSFQHRYVPVGLLERFPSDMNERPFPYRGRDELETLLSSDSSEDWVKITSMFLGPPEDNWSFAPKHKSNGYEEVTAQG